MGRFDGRVAIVTGAARGLGAAIATRLAADGARVAVADLDAQGATAHAAHIGANALGMHVDVADSDGVREMIDGVVDREGRLDILVNNAGISGPSVPVTDYPLDDWRQVLSIDLDGVFYCCRAAVPHMLANGYGRIVNIASIAGKEGNPTCPRTRQPRQA